MNRGTYVHGGDETRLVVKFIERIRSHEKKGIPMSNVDFSSDYSVFGEEVASTAYYSLEAEMLALHADSLVEVNLDLLTAANTTAGVMPEVEKFRERISVQLPKFDLTQIQKLPRAAMAAVFAQTMHLAATGKEDRLNPLYQESAKLCDVLGDEARVQIKRGILHPDALEKLRGGAGYKNTQHDLQLLVNIFRNNWPALTGKTLTTEEELARGEKLVAWLIQAVGLKEQGPADRARTADMLSRAFTLFTRMYSDVRRAIAYLLWHEGNVDNVIPSLYAGRGGSKRKEVADPAPVAPPEPEATAPGANGTSNGPLPSGTNGRGNAGFTSGNDGGPFAS